MSITHDTIDGIASVLEAPPDFLTSSTLKGFRSRKFAPSVTDLSNVKNSSVAPDLLKSPHD